MEYTNSNISLKIKKLNENAVAPLKATDGSAGYDLCACMDSAIVILPGQSAVVHTAIACQIPVGTVGLVYIRSSLGVKHQIRLSNGVGVIDSDYRGEIMVSLHNFGSKEYRVEPFDRIAQMVITPYYAPQVEIVNSLEDTDRGTGGFGSTGKR